jgi:hypothetical protein
MQRAILRRNIAYFRRALEEETDPNSRRSLQRLLTAAQRDLALLDADIAGTWLGSSAPVFRPGTHLEREVLREIDTSTNPYLLLHPGPGLHILDVNDAYAGATMTIRSQVCAQRLFEVFPDNPDDPTADGVSNLFASLRQAAGTGQPHTTPIQRYDVRTPKGKFVERYWRPVNTPLLDERGCLLYLLHHVEDVTAEIVRRPS